MEKGQPIAVAPKPLIWIAIAFGTIALVLVASVGASAVFMPACTGCHMTGEFEAQTLARSHAQVECKACHGGTTVQSRVQFGLNQVFGMTLQVKDIDPTLAQTESSQCIACHADLSATTTSGGLRIKHSSCARGRDCTDCHSPVAHGEAVSWPRTSTMELCYDCHGQRGVPSNCDTCHEARLAEDRVRTGTFAVTHGPNAERTHGLGSMASCSSCHTSEKCAKCHGVGLPHPQDFVAKHGQISGLPTAKCATCHQESFCTDCHGYEMPHPKTFLNTHAEASEEAGLPTCQRCHAQDDCEQCHLDHVHPTTLEQMRELGKIPAEGAQ